MKVTLREESTVKINIAEIDTWVCVGGDGGIGSVIRKVGEGLGVGGMCGKVR